MLKNQLKKFGVKVVAITQPLPDDSDVAEFMERIYEIMDEQYIRRTKRATFLAMLNNAKKGLVNGGISPFGYKIIDRHYEIDKREADVVKKIFDMASKGKTTRQICRWLNSQEVKPRRSKIWTESTVYYLLKNKTYLGEFYWNRHDKKTIGVKYKPEQQWVVIKNHHPAIVSEETFNKVQEQFSSRRPETKITHPKYYKKPPMLAGKIFCGQCGARYIIRSSRKTEGYYMCKNHRNGGCDNITVRRKWLENKLLELFLNEVLVERELKRAIKKLKNNLPSDDEKKRVERKYKNNIGMQKRLKELYVEGLVSKQDFYRRLSFLQAEEKALKIELEQSSRYDRLKNLSGEDIKLISQFLREKIKENPSLIRNAIERITVYKDRIEIKGLFDTEKFPLYSDGAGDPLPLLNNSSKLQFPFIIITSPYKK